MKTDQELLDDYETKKSVERILWETLVEFDALVRSYGLKLNRSLSDVRAKLDYEHERALDRKTVAEFAVVQRKGKNDTD